MRQEYEFQPLRMHHDVSLEEKRKLNETPRVCIFLLNILVFLPLWLLILLPLTLIYVLIEKLVKLCCCRKKKVPVTQNDEELELNPTDTPKNEREFDLVLYGATGFTGNFLAEYLARNYILRTNASRVSSLVNSLSSVLQIYLFG